SGTLSLCKQKRIYLPGLALPLLAAYTPKNWEVKIIIEVVDDINFNEDYDLIGIGAMGHAIFHAIDIADEFRKRGKKVFFGGYMASILPDFVKDHCDSIIIGDAEISYLQLLIDFETQGSLKAIYDNQLESLAGLPVPRYELLVQKNIGFMLPVQAGRGCPHTCSYCSIACIYKGRYLIRPLDEVMRDIIVIKNLGFKRFYLIDDNIASNPEYLFELSHRIKPLNMMWASQCTVQIAKNEKLLNAVHASGCRILSLGIESLSQKGLNMLNKSWVTVGQTGKLLQKIQQVGILPATEMIIGTDGDTPESIDETIRFISENHIPVPKFYILTPLPGTDFYKELKAKGRLLHEDYSKYTATQCVFSPAHFTPQELDNAYWKVYKSTYSWQNIFKRTLFNPHFFNAPLVYLFAFFTNLVYKKSIKNGDAPNIL
ncbi:MAG TPA: radical SAM protein, partial [Bacteroidales bacterium]|nr:radical SAM protein [Bacteroidales bacterium]